MDKTPLTFRFPGPARVFFLVLSAQRRLQAYPAIQSAARKKGIT